MARPYKNRPVISLHIIHSIWKRNAFGIRGEIVI
ncbi:MAG: hypothetical protein ACI9DF_004681 [Verrucomicrobiales bacterium]|jgi:hypothetical protein